MQRLGALLKGEVAQACVFARLLSWQPAPSVWGEPRWFVHVEDCTGSATMTRRAHVGVPPNALPGDAMRIVAVSRTIDGRPFLEADLLSIASDDETRESGASLVRRTACPSRVVDDLDRLVALFDRLSARPLRRFLGGVLAHDWLAEAFVSSRASIGHHHAYPGGLLAHSVEMAYRAAAWADRMDPDKAELVQVAALLHDIGKVHTVGADRARPMLGRWVRHEALTLEILAPHLTCLDAEWPEGGALLRHSMTWYTPARPSAYARFVGADIVRACDGIDTAIDLGKGRTASTRNFR